MFFTVISKSFINWTIKERNGLAALSKQTKLILLQRRLQEVKNKKRVIIILNLIFVIIFGIIWFQYGYDYVIGFIIALGIVVFAGMPLYDRYAKQESALLLEIQQAVEVTSE